MLSHVSAPELSAPDRDGAVCLDREAGSAFLLDRLYRVSRFVRRRHISQTDVGALSRQASGSGGADATRPAENDCRSAGQPTIFTHLAPLFDRSVHNGPRERADSRFKRSARFQAFDDKPCLSPKRCGVDAAPSPELDALHRHFDERSRGGTVQ
jgi:hypothetical protein